MKSRDDGSSPASAQARDQRLYHKLQLSAHLLRRAADRAVIEATGLSVAQVAVLNTVLGGAGVTQRAVAGTLGVNESAVTAMVRRLLVSGHLARVRDQRDPRAWTLRLTESGEAAVAQGAAAFRPINHLLAEALDGTDMRAFADRLESITALLRHPAGGSSGRPDPLS